MLKKLFSRKVPYIAAASAGDRSNPDQPSHAKLIRIKDPSRFKKFIFLSFTLTIILALIAVLVIVFVQQDQTSQVNSAVAHRDDLIFYRTFRNGTQDTYSVITRSDFAFAGAEKVSSEDRRTLHAITYQVNEDYASLFFLLLPENETLTFGDDAFLDSTINEDDTSNSTDQSLESIIEEMNLKYITCDLLVTGKIRNCLKPNYLSTTDYDYLISITDQFSPVLETKYYSKQRLLEQTINSSTFRGDYLEGRSFNFSFDQAQSKYFINNIYENVSLPTNESEGTREFIMNISTFFNAINDTILTSNQSIVSITKFSETDATEIIKDLEIYHHIELGLTNTQELEEQFSSFVGQLLALSNFYMNVTDPLRNKSSVLSASSELIPSEDMSWGNDSSIDDMGAGLNDTVFNDGSRRLAERELVIQMKQNLFRNNILGGTVQGYTKLDCYSDDKCYVKVMSDLFGIGATHFAKEFSFQVSQIAKVYKFIQYNVLTRVNAITKSIGTAPKEITAQIDLMNKQIEDQMDLLDDPLESLVKNLTQSAVTLEEQIDAFANLFSSLENIPRACLNTLIFNLKSDFTQSFNDMFYFVESYKEMYQALQSTLQNQYIDQNTKSAILDFAMYFQSNLTGYFETKKQGLQLANQILPGFLNEIISRIEPVWLGLNDTVMSQSTELLSKTTTILKDKFQTFLTQIGSNFSIYYENAVIKLSMEYMTFLDEARNIQTSLQDLLNNRTTNDVSKLDIGLIAQTREIWSLEELRAIFLASDFPFDFGSELRENVKDILAKTAKDCLSLLRSFTTYSGDAVFKKSSSDIQASTTNLFETFKTVSKRISEQLTNTFSNLINDFDKVYREASKITDKNFSPSPQEISSQPINLFEVANDVKQVFDSLQSTKTTFNQLLNVNYPVSKVQSTFNKLEGLTQSVTNSIQRITKGFQNLRDKFKVELDLIVFNGLSLQNIIQSGANQVKDLAESTLRTYLKENVKNFSDVQIQKALGLKELLLSRLAFSLPTQKIKDTNLFKVQYSVQSCISTPLLVCARGSFRVNMGIAFDFGLNSGVLFAQLAPYGQAEVQMDGFASIILVQAGAYVKGVLFRGSMPIGMGLNLERTWELNFFVDLYLETLEYETGAFVSYYKIVFKWCKIKILWKKMKFPCPRVQKTVNILWSNRVRGNKSYKRIEQKTMRLKSS